MTRRGSPRASLAWSVILVASVGGGLWLLQGMADAQTAKRTKEPVVDAASIDQKLEAILTNQQLILQKFDAVMEELRVIKIRCTS